MISFLNSTRGIVTLMIAVSILQLIYTLDLRRKFELEPIPLNSLTSFGFDVYEIGLAFQGLVIPLTIIFLISGSSLFRRAVSGNLSSRDRLKLFLLFSLIQILFFAYGYGLYKLDIGNITLAYFLIIVAGFMGGWSVGFGLAIVSFVLLGFWNLMLWPPEEYSSWVFYSYFLYNEASTPLIWVGLISGFSSKLLARRRFLPAVAFSLGLLITLLAKYLVAILDNDPSGNVRELLPVVLMSAFAMVVFVLIIRNVQANASRRQAETAELALTQSELRALRAQINPHFLFNSLNTIRYFVRTEPETARRLLLDLSEVFQRALGSGDFVSLKDEISYVESYLELEKARLDERLEVEWIIPDEAVLETPVPTLILQPLVENAVIHGVSKKTEGGKIIISIESWANDLLIHVRDNGLGFDSNDINQGIHKKQSSSRKGKPAIGLRNIDNRLRMLYGDKYKLLIESEIDKGTRVQLKIPLIRMIESTNSLEEPKRPELEG